MRIHELNSPATRDRYYFARSSNIIYERKLNRKHDQNSKICVLYNFAHTINTCTVYATVWYTDHIMTKNMKIQLWTGGHEDAIERA